MEKMHTHTGEPRGTSVRGGMLRERIRPTDDHQRVLVRAQFAERGYPSRYTHRKASVGYYSRVNDDDDDDRRRLGIMILRR